MPILPRHTRQLRSAIHAPPPLVHAQGYRAPLEFPVSPAITQTYYVQVPSSTTHAGADADTSHETHAFAAL
eukprot:1518712-Pleurochrysis_carterae.AAC.2